MNHLKDLTGRGEVYANPMFVLSVQQDATPGYSKIIVADGGAMREFMVIGSAASVAQYIDDLIDEIVNEEFEEDQEDENYGDE